MPRQGTLPRTQQLMKVGAIAAGCCVAHAAMAQTTTRRIADPPVLQDTLPTAPRAFITPGSSQQSRDRVLDLKVTYTDSQLYNPTSGRFDKVSLRSYQGKGVDPTAPYVSPTIEITPGETVRMTLDNALPVDPSCLGSGHAPDEPHCFNGTNMHTHGLWVNPAGNGDNVLLSINPGVKFTYEYNIPSDHPAGTFWYHTHRHGSTALQVSSGMAGALIIRGNRYPTDINNGDIDTLLPRSAVPERVLVMQQIQYACRGPSPAPGQLGPIKKDKDGRYICDPNDVGGIEGYDQFGPGTWPKSGRYTSLNGEIIPQFPAVQGRLERWRVIHAGVRDTISLQLFKVRPGKLKEGKLPLLTAATASSFIQQTCGTTPVPYTLIAADGLTLSKAQSTTLATFQPGYRFDALTVFPEAGQYCVLDSSAPKSGVVNALDVGPQLMAIVDVAPGIPVSDVPAYTQARLITLAEQNLPAGTQNRVIADLKEGMKLTRFTPHPDITEREITGTQELTFFIDTKTPGDTKFEVANTLNSSDARSYDPQRIDRKLPLGTAQEWTMQSHFASHPFHIHVNPFQVVSILDPNGKDVSASGATDDAGGSPPDPQYPGLKGVWKDTLWIKSLLPPPQGQTVPGTGIYTIKVRTRYERYIGQFVLHCHILDHEDEGMMQNVEVILPEQPIRSTPVRSAQDAGADGQ